MYDLYCLLGVTSARFSRANSVRLGLRPRPPPRHRHLLYQIYIFHFGRSGFDARLAVITKTVTRWSQNVESK